MRYTANNAVSENFNVTSWAQVDATGSSFQCDPKSSISLCAKIVAALFKS